MIEIRVDTLLKGGTVGRSIGWPTDEHQSHDAVAPEEGQSAFGINFRHVLAEKLCLALGVRTRRRARLLMARSSRLQ